MTVSNTPVGALDLLRAQRGALSAEVFAAGLLVAELAALP